MATAGTLALNLEARTAKLEADLRKARSEVARYASRVKQMADQAEQSGRRTTRSFARISAGASGLRTSVTALSSAMKGLAAIVVGGLALNKLLSTISDVDASIGKVSTRLDIAVESLQEYQFAASQSGIANNTLVTGMQRIIRRSQDAVNGNKQLRIAFENVGLSVEKLRRLSNSEIFQQSIIGASRLSNGLAAMQKIADTEGVALVQMGKMGEEALNGLRQQARDLGLVLSNDLVRQAEAANDKIDILQRVIRAQLTRAILQLAPYIIQFGESFARIVTALFNTNQQVKNLTDREKQIVQTLTTFADIAQNLIYYFEEAAIAVGNFISKFTNEPQLMLDEIDARIRKLRSDINIAKSEIGQFLPGFLGGKTEEEIAVLERRLQNALAARAVIQEEIARQTKDGIVKGAEAARESLKTPPIIPPGALQWPGLPSTEDADERQNAQATIAMFRERERMAEQAFQRQEREAQATIAMFRERERLQEQANQRAREEAQQTMQRFREISQRGKEAIETITLPALALQTLAQGIASGFTTAIDGVIRGTQSLGDAFKNMFRNILLSLANLMIQFAIMQAVLLVLNAIPGGSAVLSAMDAAALAGSIGPGAMSALQMSQSGSTGGAKGMAGGGVVNSPTLALLGENPANNPEFVMNKQQMQAMSREVNIILVDDRVNAERLRSELPGAIIRTVSENMLAGRGNPLNRSVRQGLGRA